MNIQIRFIHNNPKLQTTPDRLPTPVLLGFPCVSAGKESACIAGNLGSILGWEDPLEKGKFHGLYSPWGHKESDTTERLLLSENSHIKHTHL